MRGRGDDWMGAVLAGLAAGVIGVSGAVSYAALVFKDDLASEIPTGVGLVLFGAVALGLLAVFTSSCEGNIAGPQGAPIVVVGLVAAAIAGSGVENPVDTVVTFIVVASAVTGLALFALGQSGVGGLVRYLPLPVIGGYLGGTGALIVLSSIDLVAPDLDGLTTTDGLALAVPALLVAMALHVVFRRNLRPHVLAPLVIVGSSVAFHIVRALADVSIDEAKERSWVLGGFPEGPLWEVDTIGAVGGADWGEIVRHIPSIGAIVLVTAVSLLLNVTGVENERHEDYDVNLELRSAGVQNLAASLGGGLPGHMYLADSIMVSRMTRPRRLIGLVTVGVVALGMFLGSSVVATIPVFVSAGILLFLGASFVVEWVYDARRRLGALDYLLVLVIIATVTFVGYLEGLLLGVIIAVVLFVVRYSRIDVVRVQLDGTQVHSNVARSDAELRRLVATGETTAVFELQGFIFFGSAERVLRRVRARLGVDPGTTDVVLDFRRVTGIDSSAVQSFAKIARIAEATGCTVTFSALTGLITESFQAQLGDPPEGVVLMTDTLDEALQVIEDRVLGAVPIEPEATAATTIDRLLGVPNALSPLVADTEPRSIPDGVTLLVEGDPTSGIYFVESGQLVVLQGENGDRRRRAMGVGAVVGEMSWYLGTRNNSTVVADGPTVVRHLDPTLLAGLADARPEALSDLHRFVAAILAERLRHANAVVDRLMR